MFDHIDLLWEHSPIIVLSTFALSLFFSEVHHGRQQSVCAQSQCHHNQPGPPVAGPALPHASTRPFEVPCASISHPLRGSADGTTALPLTLPPSEAGGHKSICQHYYFNKAPQWWTCKKEVLTNITFNLKNTLWISLVSLALLGPRFSWEWLQIVRRGQ